MLQMQKATISKVRLCFSDGKNFSMLLVNMCSRVHVEQLCPAGLEGFANVCIQTEASSVPEDTLVRSVESLPVEDVSPKMRRNYTQVMISL